MGKIRGRLHPPHGRANPRSSHRTWGRRGLRDAERRPMSGSTRRAVRRAGISSHRLETASSGAAGAKFSIQSSIWLT